MRIFAGLTVPGGGSFDRTLEWMVPDIKACVDHGRQHGVIVGLQNHNDFLKTADETIRVVEAVNSEWFGVILDVGSLRQGDPYAEIEKLVPYAVTWQLKEKRLGTAPRKCRRISGASRRSSTGWATAGSCPSRRWGAGDPRVKVSAFLAEIRRHFARHAPGRVVRSARQAREERLQLPLVERLLLEEERGAALEHVPVALENVERRGERLVHERRARPRRWPARSARCTMRSAGMPPGPPRNPARSRS
ncbi:MAG: sugar phosphate isomerase/epimerase [Desulfobacterales bacterium]|nr:sugar phosphate isomerase/epimerase [Desulfobacterales bacterium]